MGLHNNAWTSTKLRGHPSDNMVDHKTSWMSKQNCGHPTPKCGRPSANSGGRPQEFCVDPMQRSWASMFSACGSTLQFAWTPNHVAGGLPQNMYVAIHITLVDSHKMGTGGRPHLPTMGPEHVEMGEHGCPLWMRMGPGIMRVHVMGPTLGHMDKHRVFCINARPSGPIIINTGFSPLGKDFFNKNFFCKCLSVRNLAITFAVISIFSVGRLKKSELHV